MKRTVLLVMVLCALALGSSVAFAGDMGGADNQTMPGMNSTNMNPTPDQGATPATNSTDQQPTASVSIRNFAFVPAVLTVIPGTKVIWTNQDDTNHTVTGDAPGGPASGPIAPGQSYGFTFTQRGTFAYHCTIHPMMKATVIVTGNAPSNTPPSTTPTTPPATNGSTGNGTSNTNTNTNTTNVNIDGQSSATDMAQATQSTPTTQTTIPTPSPTTSDTTAATPSELPNTGAGDVIAAFLVTVVAGAGISSVYLHKRISGA